MIRIGVDTGGTFTDLVRFGPEGVSVHKVRSTPDDPSRAIVQGIRDVADAGGTLDIVHGSTVATNAVLERRGARVALVATAGFEDVVRIGRQTRRALYDLMQEARRPLADPILELHDKNGVLITSNDNWKDTQEAEIIATGLPPTDDRESAIVTTLNPDNYTAIVRGKDDTIGVALVEVYNISP